MRSVSDIICIPVDDPTKRFLLGKSGKAELLAIGLNPSTANEKKLDPTSRNIQSIANNNGCDGWWLVNLHPKRTSKPSNLPKKPDISLLQENHDFIEGMVKDSSYNVAKVLCCWGDNIRRQNYLQTQASEIIKVIEELNIPFQCIGTTKSGNPFHPAPMPVNRFLGGINQITLKSFEPDSYKPR